jgi:ATP-binding cassette, subfamily F, member 3
VLTVSQLSKSFGGQTLFEDASLQVNRGERIALIGPNGAGKTTLFSILLDLDEADTGEVALQRGVRVGFLPQESAPVGDETVLQVATGIAGGEPASEDHQADESEASFSADLQQVEAKAKRILKGLAFRETDYARQAKTMSGGWIMRAHLARLLVMEPDLLLLDEPTNHLDLESINALNVSLQKYEGTVLLVTHDHDVIDEVATRIWHFQNGRIEDFKGPYADYLLYAQEKAAVGR